MKICQECWKKLRDAIDQRGLSRFIAKDGKNAGAIMTAQVEGDQSSATFEPLLAANFRIWEVSLQTFGMGMMAEDAPCPLCYKTELESQCTDPACSKQTGDDWIRFAADEQLQQARERGLVSQPN